MGKLWCKDFWHLEVYLPDVQIKRSYETRTVSRLCQAMFVYSMCIRICSVVPLHMHTDLYLHAYIGTYLHTHTNSPPAYAHICFYIYIYMFYVHKLACLEQNILLYIHIYIYVRVHTLS